MDLYWEGPAWSDFFSRLAAFSRLILFDKRGTGLSDRMAGVATLEERMDDVRAVMDAAHSEKAALYGVSEGGPMALLFTATYPDRTRALVLYGSYACHPSTLSAENIDQHIATIDRAWGTGEYTAQGFCARTAADETFLRALARFERQGASPSAAATIVRMQFATDARHVLSTIRVPTLVLHRVGDPRITVDAGRYVADHIPGAKYVELPGIDHNFLLTGERDMADRVADEIEEFLTGSRSETEIDRVLATVMFTDIVDSTKRAAELGDRQWRALLDRHDEAVRQQLQRFRGKEVKNLGDGFMATFDGPARAVRCAAAISDAVRPLGIAVRSGLHTGEIDLTPGDIAGTPCTSPPASRRAEAGETVVSSTVRDLVARSGLRASKTAASMR
jgi:pimeloyl-ACP methyl ester carboxylesterase